MLKLDPNADKIPPVIHVVISMPVGSGIRIHNHEVTWNAGISTKLEKSRKSGSDTNSGLVTVVATVAIVLGLLGVVLELAAEHRACYGAQDAVTAHLVATEVSGSTATESAHQTTVTLLLHGWVTGAVLLLPGLPVGILALWVLVLAVGSLLGELVLGLRAGISSLLILAVLPEFVVREVCFET